MDNSTEFGVASKITGIVYLRIGEQEPAKLVDGDLLMLGQTLILTNGSRINFDNGLNFEGPTEILLSNDMIADIATNTQEAEVSDITVDAVLAILAEGGDLLDSIEAPAAGLDGDDGAQGHSFIRLARISENADTQDFVGGTPSAQAAGTPEDATDNINIAPIAVDDVIEGDEDSTIVIQVVDNDSDENGDDLTVIDVTLPTNGSAVINDDGSISYTPNENFNGTDSFEYTIDDGNGGTDTATVTVNVNPVNDPPVAGELDDRSYSDADNINLDVSSAFSDVENDSLTYSASGLPAGLSINPDTGVISGTIDASASDQTDDDNNVQVYNITVTANDGSDSTSTSFDWTINNTIPVAGNDSFNTLEDTGLIISASNLLSNDSDLDGDALSISAIDTSSANGGSITNNGNGTYTYTPAANYFGTDSFEYSITDSEGGSSTAKVNITVTAVSDLVDGDETNSVDEDTTLTVADGAAGDLLNNATSSDGSPITITQFMVAGDTDTYAAGSTAVIAGVGSLTINANGS
ncbi:retention module-containing protein, partial [Zhongshania sp.]|uniref:retention module-containing protein n=1 Tax=Zhongshania sp. TaxID=1971902 RepID=UPI0035658C12